jgi:hypothetical protein
VLITESKKLFSIVQRMSYTLCDTSGSNPKTMNPDLAEAAVTACKKEYVIHPTDTLEFEPEGHHYHTSQWSTNHPGNRAHNFHPHPGQQIHHKDNRRPEVKTT